MPVVPRGAQRVERRAVHTRARLRQHHVPVLTGGRLRHAAGKMIRTNEGNGEPFWSRNSVLRIVTFSWFKWQFWAKIVFTFCVREGCLIARLRLYYRLEWVRLFAIMSEAAIGSHSGPICSVKSVGKWNQLQSNPHIPPPSLRAYECLWTEIPCYKYFDLQPPPKTLPQIDSGAISGFDCRYLNPVPAWYAQNPHSIGLTLRMKHCICSLEAELSCQPEHGYVLACYIIAPPARRIITS